MTYIHYTQEQIMAMAQPLFNVMAQRVTAEEMGKIYRAFEVASEKHATQVRKTGEPYIIHPIAVARIVGEELGLGATPVCAAFLHDVVEDTDTTIQQIEEWFGKDVAFLVRVVTKTKKEKYELGKQVDNFKQMLDSVKYDIRALLIKLADRLHNMRTLSSMRPDKQMKIAGETDFFYAPLANRLGLYRVKVELENLSFRYRCPREYARLTEMLKADEEKNRPVVDHFIARINEALSANGIKALIEAEYRQPFSIQRKVDKTGRDFHHIENRHFMRIVFGDTLGASEKGMALRIYAILTDIFKEKPGSVINYIDSPKENGKWEEMHISSERMRRVSRQGCIAEREEGNIGRWIENLKSTLQDIAYHNHEIGFMEGVVSRFYNDDIMVFTPQGKPVTLPQGSTAIDFAFEVHTDLGLHAKYARINGRLSSVKTVLHRGDCVEIGADNSISPQADWLNHVQTYKAKRHIKSFVTHVAQSKYVRCEHCKPLPGDEVVGFRRADGHIKIHQRSCRHAISRASQEGDSVLAVDFKEDGTLYPVMLRVRAIDRYHLLRDMTDCITNTLRLSIDHLKTDTVDEIVESSIEFRVHSFNELQTVIDHLNDIEGVDEVIH